MTCLPFDADETSFNCASYLLSKECFHKFIRTSSLDQNSKMKTVSRGFEYGEENFAA